MTTRPNGGAFSAKRRCFSLPNVMPSITICIFLSLTNGFKLFDQNLALNIYNTFYGQNSASQGTAQAKAVIFFILVAGLGLAQLAYTRKREVQQ